MIHRQVFSWIAEFAYAHTGKRRANDLDHLPYLPVSASVCHNDPEHLPCRAAALTPLQTASAGRFVHPPRLLKRSKAPDKLAYQG